MADAHHRRGEKLASALDEFVRREAEGPEEAAAILIGAYEYLAARTALARDPTTEPWPIETDAKLGEPN